MLRHGRRDDESIGASARSSDSTATEFARLLVVTTAPVTLNFLLPYAEHFRRGGWRVDAATGPGDVRRWLDHFDRIWSIPWTRRPTDRATWVSAPQAFRRVLASGEYDIVHLHTPIAAFVGRAVIATRWPRPSVVYTAHGFHFHHAGRPTTNAAYLVAERLAGRCTDHLIVMNHEDHSAALRHRIVAPARLHKLPGIGLDLDVYAPRPELAAAATAWRRALDVGNGRLFTVIAELQPGKDHLTVIRALAANPDHTVHLAFAGNGPMRDALEAEAHRLHVADRVHFLGFVSDIRPLVLASAATVLPSRREGLPRAVLESLALGVPVIGARTRGITDLLGDGRGLLVAPGDVQGFARAFDDISSLRLGVEPESQMKEFGIDNLIRLHEQIYAAALRARGAAGTATGGRLGAAARLKGQPSYRPTGVSASDAAEADTRRPTGSDARST